MSCRLYFCPEGQSFTLDLIKITVFSRLFHEQIFRNFYKENLYEKF